MTRQHSPHARMSPEWIADQLDDIREDIAEFKQFKVQLIAWVTAISFCSSLAWGIGREVLWPRPVEAATRYEAKR